MECTAPTVRVEEDGEHVLSRKGVTELSRGRKGCDRVVRLTVGTSSKMKPFSIQYGQLSSIARTYRFALCFAAMAFDCDDVIRREHVSRSRGLPHRKVTDGLRRPPI